MARKKKTKKRLQTYNLRTKITSALRKIWLYHPAKKEALKRAEVEKGWYECFSCEHSFQGKDVSVDHTEPVVCPKDGFIDWNNYIDRMFCAIENLQVLCKKCHLKKTNEEKAERMLNRRKKKS